MIKEKLKNLRSFVLSPSGCYNISKFVSYMQSFSREIGMHNSYFDAPSGASALSYTTAHDLFLLSDVFFSDETLQSFCSTQHVSINGKTYINETLTAALSEFDTPIAIKTGTWSDRHKAISLHTDISLICVLSDCKEIFDNIFYVSKKISEGKYPPPDNTSIAWYGSVCGNIISYNEYRRFLPASTTKLLTALCAKNICGLDGSVTVNKIDIVGGSGSVYAVGDTFTMSDAIQIMLMESSNTLSNAIARTCGKLI